MGLMAPGHADVSAVRGPLLAAEKGKESVPMSIFPTTILLATDGTEEAELARTTAVDMAASTDSELHLVTVVPGYPSYDVNVPNVVEQLRERRRSSMSNPRR
jgi:hypothetical protein